MDLPSLVSAATAGESPTAPVAIVSVVVPAVVSIITIFVTRWLSRDTHRAEIEKMKAETEKLRAETAKLSGDMAVVSYAAVTSAERVIYDGTRAEGFDFKGEPGRFYGADKKPTGPAGLGTLRVSEGVLMIDRTNAEGRFQVWLRQYTYDGEREVLPGSPLTAGKRKLRISCEAKIVGAHHSLRFVVKSTAKTGEWLANQEVRVTSNEWMPVEFFFLVSPEECQIRIDDENVSRAPSSVQIRHLRITEKR